MVHEAIPAPIVHRFCRAGGKQTLVDKDRSTENDQQQEGHPYSLVASLLGLRSKTCGGDLSRLCSRCTSLNPAGLRVATPIALISMTKTKSSTNNWTMIGTLTSVFSLIIFLATTNAFVVVIPKVARRPAGGCRWRAVADRRQRCCGSQEESAQDTYSRGLHRVRPEHLRAARVQGVRGETLSYLQHLPSAWQQRFYSTSYVHTSSLLIVGGRSLRACGPVQAYFVHNILVPV